MTTRPSLLRGALLASLVLLGVKAWAASNAQAAPAELQTIPALDLPRYLGTWYEIAKFPNRFQRKCTGFTTATYLALPDGRVQVENRCRLADGSTDVATGVARQIGDAASPRLKVRFAPAILSFIPIVWGNYWVIDLDPDYALAAVSEPGREYLWILARTPTVEKAAYDALVARLARQGLDVRKLERTPQQ
ncbi:lipocalin family protein [Massilia niabensis]|uniref:Outer membrane lipoprotein Blc n=1 Tax=Massilia niabensis TaxID=544910 RepID=A0ABW0L1N4_9BURK